MRSAEAARLQHRPRRRGMDIERICLVLCKYAERFEAEGAETEQVNSPVAATEPATRSTVPVSKHQ